MEPSLVAYLLEILVVLVAVSGVVLLALGILVVRRLRDLNQNLEVVQSILVEQDEERLEALSSVLKDVHAIRSDVSWLDFRARTRRSVPPQDK